MPPQPAMLLQVDSGRGGECEVCGKAAEGPLGLGFLCS